MVSVVFLEREHLKVAMEKRAFDSGSGCPEKKSEIQYSTLYQIHSSPCCHHKIWSLRLEI